MAGGDDQDGHGAIEKEPVKRRAFKAKLRNSCRAVEAAYDAMLPNANPTADDKRIHRELGRIRCALQKLAFQRPPSTFS